MMGLRLATRGSALAMAQAQGVAEMLGGAELVGAGADGDAVDKSRFVRGVERVLLEGGAEIGVHSAKDLPAAMPDELAIAGVPKREEPADAWVGPGSSLDDAPQGARVGTSSLRRRAQLLARRPDLDVVDLRGNVDTRLAKLAEGEFDAILLAAAGLRRLGRSGEIGFLVNSGEMIPAPGQGALALQVRAGDDAARSAAAGISDESALIEVTAERAAVASLDASCNTPIGISARRDGARLKIEGFAGLPDGTEWVRDRLDGEAEQPAELGEELARRMVSAGAAEILAEAESRNEERGTRNDS